MSRNTAIGLLVIEAMRMYKDVDKYLLDGLNFAITTFERKRKEEEASPDTEMLINQQLVM